MENLISHAEQLLVVLFAVHALALAIVNLTDTPKDNEIVSKYYKILEVFAGIVTKLAKRWPEKVVESHRELNTPWTTPHYREIG